MFYFGYLQWKGEKQEAKKREATFHYFEYHQKNVPVCFKRKMMDASNTGKKDIQFCMITNDDTKKIRCQVVSTPTTTITPPSIMSSSFSSLDQSRTKRRVSVEKAFDCYFYVVHSNEIVGRYGANLIDALSHLRLLSGKSRSPDNSRALIPVINSRICHPFELLSCLPLQEYILQERNKEHGLNKQLLFQIMKCCHWTNNHALQRMQYMVQREHCILQPAIYSKSQIRCNSNVVISLPTLGRNGEKDFSSRVRSKCLEFLNELQHLDDVRGVSNFHVVKDDD